MLWCSELLRLGGKPLAGALSLFLFLFFLIINIVITITVLDMTASIIITKFVKKKEEEERFNIEQGISQQGGRSYVIMRWTGEKNFGHFLQIANMCKNCHFCCDSRIRN